MIPLNSKSYPYLAIAQHYGIKYGEVLKFVDWLENTSSKLEEYDILGWRLMTYTVWHNEQERRKQVLGV